MRKIGTVLTVKGPRKEGPLKKEVPPKGPRVIKGPGKIDTVSTILPITHQEDKELLDFFMQMTRSHKLKLGYGKQGNSLLIWNQNVGPVSVPIDGIIKDSLHYTEGILNQNQVVVVNYDHFIMTFKESRGQKYRDRMADAHQQLAEAKCEISREEHKLLTQNFLYAPLLASALSELHPVYIKYGVTQTQQRQIEGMLNRHPEYAIDLARGIAFFNTTLSLTSDPKLNPEMLFQKVPQDLYALIIVMQVKREGYQSAVACGKVTFAENPRDAAYIMEMVKKLLQSTHVKKGISTEHHQKNIKDYVETLEESFSLSEKAGWPPFDAFSIAAGRKELRKESRWFAYQQQSILEQYPEYASTLALGMVRLKNAGYFSPENLKFLTISAEHSLDLACLLVKFNQLKLLDVATLSRLEKIVAKKPEHARLIYLAAKELPQLPAEIQSKAKYFLTQCPEQGLNLIFALNSVWDSFIPISEKSILDSLFPFFTKYPDRAISFAIVFIHLLTVREYSPAECRTLLNKHSDNIEEIAAALQYLKTVKDELAADDVAKLLFTNDFNLKYAIRIVKTYILYLDRDNRGGMSSKRMIDALTPFLKNHPAAGIDRYAKEIAGGVELLFVLKIATPSNVSALIEYRMDIPEIRMQLVGLNLAGERGVTAVLNVKKTQQEWQDTFSNIIKKLQIEKKIIPFIEGDDPKNQAAPISSAFFRNSIYDGNLLKTICDFELPVVSADAQRSLKK